MSSDPKMKNEKQEKLKILSTVRKSILEEKKYIL